jgi:hypothetical protein
MNRFFKILLFVMLAMVVVTQFAQAEDVSESSTFSVTIPKAIKLEGIGISPRKQYHGIPADQEAVFNLRVADSYDGHNFELTTREPIGVSVSYNSGGHIMAVFISMIRQEDGFQIPQSDIRIYPSKVIFETGSGGGDAQRIFHFNPIIRISKDTPPGNYVGTITFTILGQ